MSTYELERKANIEKNRALLLSLGLEAPKSESQPVRSLPRPAQFMLILAQASVKAVKPRVNSAPKRLQTAEKREGSRKSARIANIPAAQVDDSLLSDGDESKPSPLKIRRLARVSIPNAPEAEVFDPTHFEPLPTRSADGTLHFKSAPHFTPNLTPEEMMRRGSFGGTAFRYRSAYLSKSSV